MHYTLGEIRATYTMQPLLIISYENRACNNGFFVRHINIPPIADAGTNQIVSESKDVVLNGTKSHAPDGTVKSYLWTQSAGPKVNLSAANTANPTFIAPHVLSDTTLMFNLKVTDNEGSNSTNFSSTKVIVKHVNKPPIANAGADQTVNESATVTLDGSNSTTQHGARGSLLMFKSLAS
ncbi:MAG: hypothetical protein WAM14_02255 [Candidatus Nitrosopolaris sp.]